MIKYALFRRYTRRVPRLVYRDPNSRNIKEAAELQGLFHVKVDKSLNINYPFEKEQHQTTTQSDRGCPRHRGNRENKNNKIPCRENVGNLVKLSKDRENTFPGPRRTQEISGMNIFDVTCI